MAHGFIDGSSLYKVDCPKCGRERCMVETFKYDVDDTKIDKKVECVHCGHSRPN